MKKLRIENGGRVEKALCGKRIILPNHAHRIIAIEISNSGQTARIIAGWGIGKRVRIVW